MTHDSLDRPDRYAPTVGLFVAMLDECRGRTLRAVGDLGPDLVDAAAAGHVNTIGSILYHIAAIELDWLYVEVLGRDFPAEAFEGGWFPHEVREEGGRLTAVVGDSLDRHRERLAWVRSLLHDGLAGLTDDDLQAERPTHDGTVTPEWVFHHLMQHEAEHRGQMGEIATALRAP
jgi:uncharacterized damage-inducible protein DinB